MKMFVFAEIVLTALSAICWFMAAVFFAPKGHGVLKEGAGHNLATDLWSACLCATLAAVFAATAALCHLRLMLG
jgi:hypothetical protein